MKILYLMCSESGAVDTTTNRLSIFNVLEEINAVAFPVIQPSLLISMLIERLPADPSNCTLQIVVNANNQQLFTIPMPVDFQGKLRARSLAQVQGVLLSAPGQLKIQAIYEKNPLAEWVGPINLINQPQAQLVVQQQNIAASPTVQSTTTGPSAARPATRSRRKRKTL
jgi:hypothetical protein